MLKKMATTCVQCIRLLLMNAEDSSNITPQAFFPISGWTQRVKVESDTIHVAAGRFGIYSLSVDENNVSNGFVRLFLDRELELTGQVIKELSHLSALLVGRCYESNLLNVTGLLELLHD